jgi:hypothetical protein
MPHGKRGRQEGQAKEVAMKKTIFARVAAKPINFPERLEVILHGLDELEILIGPKYSGVFLSWEEVQRNYWLSADFAKECEVDLRNGETRFLGNKHVTIDE